MRVKFHQSLDDLKEKLLVMAGMAEQAIQRSIEAYSTRDLAICELVFRAEPSINRLEREIDQMALDLLAMEQPMAIDLRFILSVIRINADLERVGDQAVNIAVRVREMGAFANIDLPVDIPKLASLSSACTANHASLVCWEDLCGLGLLPRSHEDPRFDEMAHAKPPRTQSGPPTFRKILTSA